MTTLARRGASPARAGMDRRAGIPGRMFFGFPRTGGDGPFQRDANAPSPALPPHGRGWTSIHSS